MITVEAVIVIAGWLVSLLVALKAVPHLAAKRVSEQFGLTLVEQNGKSFYAPVDPEGKPIQIPVGIKEDDDGNKVPIMGFAPLAYCLPYMAAEMAAVKVKMSLFNAKSQISKKMQKEGLQAAMAEGGGLDAMMPFLPKKAQIAAALLKSLGVGGAAGPVSTPNDANRHPHSPGGEK